MANNSSKEYQLLRGVVANLRTTDAKVNPLQSSAEAVMGSWAAVTQAILNVPGAISSAQLASDEGDSVEVATMVINGVSVTGYFWQIGFGEGDEVEVAGTMHREFFDAVAVRTTRERAIWLRPHYSMGSKALRRADLERIVKFSLAMDAFAFVLFPGIALVTSTGHEKWMKLFAGVFCVCAVFNIVCAVILRTPQRLDFSKQVDAIGRAFGMRHPEMLDFDRAYELARASGKPFLNGGMYY